MDFASAHSLPSHYRLSVFYDDANISQKMAEDVLTTLKEAKDDRDCESKLVMLLTYDRFDLIRKFRKNRDVILHGTMLHRATAAERVDLEAAMEADSVLSQVLARLRGGDTTATDGKTRGKSKSKEKADAAAATDAASKQVLKLADFEFSGGHFMANKSVQLPEGSTRKSLKGYEEVFIPAPATKPMGANEKLILITDMPEWAQPCFKGYDSLNRVQSRL
jgi:pre-mRNA-splicing helicase BRR2